MKLKFNILLSALLFGVVFGQETPAPADPNQRTAALEARLRQTLESSGEAAQILLELTDLYHQQGQVFGLIRAGKTFVSAQAGHPKHEEVMAKLIDGLAIANRNADLKAVIVQFLERYPASARAAGFHRMLGEVYQRENQRRDAADQYRKAWEILGAKGLDEAERAFVHYRDLRSNDAAKVMGEMALKILDQLPPNASASEFGWQAVNQTRSYGNQTQLSSEIARKMLAKKVPLTGTRVWEIHNILGDNFRNERQYANAIKAYRDAIANQSTNAETWRSLVRSLYDARSSVPEITAAVNDYLNRFPQETPSRKAEILTIEAPARQAAGDLPGALETLHKALKLNASSANTLFSWAGEEPLWPRAEQIYQDAAKSQPEEAWRLHYHAAFNYYRDRRKDINRARDLLRNELLYKNPLPNAGSSFNDALGFLISTAENEQAFQAELKRYFDHALKNGDNQPYLKALEPWLAEAKRSKDPEVRKKFTWAQDNYQNLRNQEVIRLWAAAQQNQMRGHAAREQLLRSNLSPEQKIALLTLHAQDIQQYGDQRKRQDCLALYQELARLKPRDYRIARQWLEAAQSYGDQQTVRPALEYFLGFDQEYREATPFYYVFTAADKIGDKTLVRRAYDWCLKNQKRHGWSNGYSSNVIGYLKKYEFLEEAKAYAMEAAKYRDQGTEASGAVQYLAGLLPEGKERIAIYEPYFNAPVDDLHSYFGNSLAYEYFRIGDYANWERVCRESRKRQDDRRLLPWYFTLHDWVGRALQDAAITADQKLKIYRTCRDMRFDRESAMAELALLEMEGHKMKPVERLLAYRKTSLDSQNDSTSFQYLLAWGQKAVGRKEFAEAATIGTALLANIPNVGVDYQDRARVMVREAYGKMGALGMEVSADNPIAPLLEIGLHLRLGDRERALQAYSANQGRFDEFMLELPAELVAFAADSHIAAGGEENQDRAESILRKWMIAHSESDKFTPGEKARMQLLLAKNYDRAKRYEVARNELTTVVNRYPGTEEAVEARFGIGETLLSQKIFDQAEETFSELANSPLAKVRIRGMFLLGVLENRKGNADEARRIFKDVLTSMPDVSLANETLFNLSEVYRGEQRYLEQLELLRTVGRLGQESKRWHEPGRALSIVVQDSDLGISRGHSRIPVEVITHPGGDKEMAYITSGGAGKGLFIGEIETALGEPVSGNGILEVSGGDLIKVDYPAEFKKEFKFEPLATGDIGLAVDATFKMASSRILDESEESEAKRLSREAAAEGGDLRLSIQRPANQIKPGNPVYLRVRDLDRDLSGKMDEVKVKVTASSGDEVQAVLTETASHGGVFEGSIQTSDLPAGALATDTAIEHSPLMAIDKDETSAWMSQPDGVTPKFLSVDLKELRSVTKGTFATPDPASGAPVRARLQGSHDGRYWYPLAEFPQRPPLDLPQGKVGRMTRKVWHIGAPYTEWSQVLRVTSSQPHEEAEADELVYATELPIDPEERRKLKADPCGVLFQGKFIQPRAGAIRVLMRGDRVAMIINGFPVQPLVTVQREHEVDVYLEAGIHDLLLFGSTSDSARRKVEFLRARENPNHSEVRLTRFVKEDFDLGQTFVSNLKPISDYPLGSMSVNEKGTWQFAIEPRELRHVRFVVDEYLGQAVVINHVTVSGPDKNYIPTEADLLQLSSNNVLEITPGDRIDSVYIDELPTGGQPKNRALSQNLRATYHDGTIESIAYYFARLSNGQVEEIEKDLLRIDPSERITLKITDFDKDSTGQPDQVEVSVQIGDGEIRQLTATETEPTSGVFKIEIDTFDPAAEAAKAAADAANPKKPGESKAGKAEKPAAADRLAVKKGDQIYFTYRDQENTFPGHAIDRQSAVFVREPTKGKMRIIETRYTPPIEEGRSAQTAYLPPQATDSKGVAYEMPLTIEVIDEDAARDSLSEVIVQVSLKGPHSEKPKSGTPGIAPQPDGAPAAPPAAPPLPVEVACRVSPAFSDLDETLANVANPALRQGRFIGQVTLRLGDETSPRLVPREPGVANTLVGRVLPPRENDPATGEDKPLAENEIDPSMIGVLNLTGTDAIMVSYIDRENPSGAEVSLADRGHLLGASSLAATDVSYETAVEKLQVGERIYLRLSDPDRDQSAERDRVEVEVTSANGEKEKVALEETLSHSGVFTGSFKLKAKPDPKAGNFDPALAELEVFFGQSLKIAYTDPVPPGKGEKDANRQVVVPISDGTDGEVAAFTKIFGNEDLAIQTQFHIAESFFELFKSHLNLGRKDEADTDLKNGRRILRELREDYPDPKYAPRVAYLLGQFAQELKSWDEAIEAYETIVKQHPDHALAADAQYKLGQCYEEANRLDDALEAYVTLAATYPENPLISSVMIRINDHFYKKEDYEVAAQVGERFLERFENHEYAPRMAFRVGQCYYKNEKYKVAGQAFDDFVKRFPEDELTPQALFWAGESFRQGNENKVAFQRYNRCRWDFPESDAAKYSRGRLALPEMIAQFESEARAVEMEQQ